MKIVLSKNKSYLIIFNLKLITHDYLLAAIYIYSKSQLPTRAHTRCVWLHFLKRLELYTQRTECSVIKSKSPPQCFK